MPFVALDQPTPTHVQWLWPGRLPLDHLAIFDGDPGLGKSLVTLRQKSPLPRWVFFPAAPMLFTFT